jgi:hypothetical protein
MAKPTNSISPLMAHEKECAIRYENIEKRLEEGSEKFKRIETIMWGVYPFMVSCLVASKFI